MSSKYDHILERLGGIEQRLVEITGLLARQHPVQKDWYTCSEIAAILGRRPYTVREWCRYGRIHAEKRSGVGRGSEEAWRISHDELVRYQNDGLLPLRRPPY